MAKRVWTLVQRLPLIESTKRKSTTIFAPRVGPRGLAIVAGRDFSLLLRRADLSPLWQGSMKDAFLVGWSDGDVLLLQDLQENEGVAWSAAEKGTAWRAPAAAGCAISGSHVVLCPSPGRLELRAAKTGEVIVAKDLSAQVRGPLVLGDTVVCRTEDSVVGSQLPTFEPAWAVALDREFDGLYGTAERKPPSVRRHTEGRTVLVTRGGAMGLLDVTSGAFLWRRTWRSGLAAPLMAAGRVAFFAGGKLDILDEVTGKHLVHTEGVAPTVWDKAPAAYGDWMVVVDENGYIVTVDLRDGGIVGVQREKGIGFDGGATVADGRLMAGGRDGALWVYEPTGDPPPSVVPPARSA